MQQRSNSGVLTDKMMFAASLSRYLSTSKRSLLVGILVASVHTHASSSSSSPSRVKSHLRFQCFVRDQCKSGFDKLEDAHHLFDHMLHRKPPLSIISYTQLFGAVAKMGHYSSVIPLYTRMISTLQLRPDQYTLTILINCLCHLNQVGLAFTVLAHMFRSGYDLNVVTLTTLIKGLCIQGNVSKAVELLSKAQIMSDVVPDVEAARLFNKMQIHSKGPNLFSRDVLFDGLSESQSLREAIKLFHVIVNKNLHPNIVTYNTLMSGMIAVGKLENAIKLFNHIPLKGLRSDVISYNTMIHGFCKEGMLEEANQRFLQMEENGYVPNKITFRTLLRGYLRENDTMKVKALTCEMIERGLLQGNQQ